MSKRDSLLLLEDMLDAAQKINRYTLNLSFEEFLSDEKTVDAVVRNFEIIGEASKNLPSHIKENNPDIPWAEMYLLRNKVSHEYFGIDYEIIWDVCINHLPENRLQIQSIIDSL